MKRNKTIILCLVEKIFDTLNPNFFDSKRIKEKIKYLLRYRYIYALRHRISQDTSIISTNCFAGRIMQDLKMRYNSPTEGIYFMYPDYIKFLQNLRYYFTEATLSFVQTSKYESCNKRRSDLGINYPIGLLGDVEIHFLHYGSEKEAKDKWIRRASRINWSKLLIIGMMQNECTEADIVDFDSLPYQNKIMFSAKNINLKSIVYIPKYSEQNVVGDPYKDTRLFYKYLVKYMKKNNIDFKNK